MGVCDGISLGLIDLIMEGKVDKVLLGLVLFIIVGSLDNNVVEGGAVNTFEGILLGKVGSEVGTFSGVLLGSALGLLDGSREVVVDGTLLGTALDTVVPVGIGMLLGAEVGSIGAHEITAPSLIQLFSVLLGG